MDATIYHNPRCTKSRQALARLEEAGINVTVVKYLDDVPTTTQLKKLIADGADGAGGSAHRGDRVQGIRPC